MAGPAAQSPAAAAQAEAGVKANEVPMAKEVPGQIDLHGKLVTADALHTLKATAGFICDHGGEFVLPAKENRRALSGALGAALASGADRSHRHRPRPQPDRNPHHPGAARAGRSPVPARQPDPADRTLHQRPAREAHLSGSRARRRQRFP
jgi:hypothetical protein